MRETMNSLGNTWGFLNFKIVHFYKKTMFNHFKSNEKGRDTTAACIEA